MNTKECGSGHSLFLKYQPGETEKNPNKPYQDCWPLGQKLKPRNANHSITICVNKLNIYICGTL